MPSVLFVVFGIVRYISVMGQNMVAINSNVRAVYNVSFEVVQQPKQLVVFDVTDWMLLATTEVKIKGWPNYYFASLLFFVKFICKFSFFEVW